MMIFDDVSHISDAELITMEALLNNAFVESLANEGIVHRLLWSGHINRCPMGSLRLTKSGELRVFHVQCRVALALLRTEQILNTTDDVKSWLVSSGFIKDDKASATPFVTRRGLEWLASL